MSTDPDAPLTPEEESAHDRQGQLVREQIDERRRQGLDPVPPLPDSRQWR